MPAPTNISALTAIDIGASLPYATTQDAHFAGVTYSLWYSYTAQPGDNVIGVFGYGTIGSGYGSFLSVYTGPAAAPVLYLINGANRNHCVYFPVTPGTTYYFQFEKSSGNPSPAILTINIQAHTDVDAPAGSIGINDDFAGFPFAILDATVSPVSVLKYVQNVVAGENVGVLDNGIIAVEEEVSGVPIRTAIYDTSYTEIASVANYGRGITTNRVDAFYAAGFFNPGPIWRVVKFNTVGTVLLTTSALAFPVSAIAVSPDESILYYFLVQGATEIRRWDLINDVALSSLTTIAGQLIKDMFTLADGRVVVGDATHDTLVLVNPNGTISATWPLATLGLADRICRDLTDASAWVWNKSNGTDETFLQIDLATGATLQTITGVLFNAGIAQENETATPFARFSNSFSCPFWITRTSTATSGSITVVKVTAPSGLPDLFDFTAGGGLAPTSFQLADGGTQDFLGLTPMAGYSIVEAPAAGFSTLISVSNGSSNTNISVGSGEAVTVTVTNTQAQPPGGEPGCPLGAPPPVTGENGCTIPDGF